MPNKYYIYARGRWCEVDLRRGRVEGFRQRALFCYLRGVRLEMGRTATVLRALQALAAGAGGAARDSVRLFYRRPHRSRRDSVRAHRCCSQHLHHSRCDVNANELNDKPAAVQETSPRKRKRSRSEESHKAKHLKSEEKHNSPQKAAITVRDEDIVKNLLEDKDKLSSQKKTGKVRGIEDEKIVETLHQISSDDVKQKQQRPGPTSRKEVRPESKSPQKLQRANTVTREKEEEKPVQSLLQSSSDDEQVSNAPLKPTPKSKPESDSTSEQREMCKELVIDDRVVRVLRGFLARSVGRQELARFDKDEVYKTRVLYKLNPLVCLNRYGPLEKLLTQRLTLEEFASHLGLRSVADVTPEKRYRMRHSTRQARQTASVTSDSEKQKHAVLPKRRQLWNRDKQVFSQSSRSSEIKVKPQIHRPARDSSRDTTDSDTEVKQHIRRHLERRASAKINPEQKETRTNKNNDKSIVVESDSDESNSVQRITRRRSKGTNKNKESVVISDDNSIDKQRITRRKSTGSKKDEESVVVSDGNSSETHNQKKTRERSKRPKDDESVIVSDESSSNTDGNQRKTRRMSKGTKEDDESVVQSDETSSDTVMIIHKKTNEKSKRPKDDESVIVSDESSSNTDGNQRKTRRMSKGTKEDDESVVQSDETSNDTDDHHKKTNERSKGSKKDDDSNVVSDSDSVNIKRPSRAKTRTKNKTGDDNESVVVSDKSDNSNESSSNATDKNVGRCTRRTRSQGPDKRVPRKHYKSEMISDTDSSVPDRMKTRARSMDTDKTHNKDIEIDESISNTDENRGKNARAQSKSIDRTNRKREGNSNKNTRARSKSTDTTNTKREGNSNKNARARSKSTDTTNTKREGNSNKNARAQSKSTDRTNTKREGNSNKNARARSKSTDRTNTKREGNSNKHARARSKSTDTTNTKREGNSNKNARAQSKSTDRTNTKREGNSNKNARAQSKSTDRTNTKREGNSNKNAKVKVSSKKIETGKEQEKSVISDSSDAFETTKNSPKKNNNKIIVRNDLAKRISALNTPRNNKGRFLKRNPIDKEKNKSNEQESQNTNKDGIEKDRKGNDKNEVANETNKNKNKMLRDRIDTDKAAKEISKGDDKSTENKGKENSRKTAAVRSMFIKPVKFKKSSVANGREYTSLEDHAIVAWVSVGNRERRVNGNAIWRELQGEYTRLTSQTRSWHSLRNRYLRYILPSLGRLALPPAQVSRLRAAAAVGNIKNASRRNSIFKQQRVLSAATAGRLRFRPVSSDSESDQEKAPTPPPRRRSARSPSKAPVSPSKAPPSPASPRAPRLRPRSSGASAATPTPKKKRVHHL